MKILVLGGGGFIGGHIAKHHKDAGNWVRIVDIKRHEYFREDEICNEFIHGDLRDSSVMSMAMRPLAGGPFDRVYQLAADMGGAGYVFIGDNDADIVHNSALINLNAVQKAVEYEVEKIFFSSSSCIYPVGNQMEKSIVTCKESTAYPANPDSDYGWEKLFSERVYQAFARNYGLDIRIARFHNIFGTHGTYNGGKEGVTAALCRKVLRSDGEINIWGDGEQSRSFLIHSECVEAVERLMASDFMGPVNIGSTEMVTVNQLANMIVAISGKKIMVKHIDGPVGVRARNSDNALINKELGWCPTTKLYNGLIQTYGWIQSQLKDDDDINSIRDKT